MIRHTSIIFLLICGILSIQTFSQVHCNTAPKLHTSDLELYQELEDLYMIKRVHVDYDQMKKYKDKIQTIEKLYCFYKINLDEKKLGFLSFILGKIYYHTKEEYEIASTYFIESYIYKEHLINEIKAVLYITLGDLEKIQQRYINSIYFFKKALELSSEHGIKKNEYTSLREIGVIYRDLEMYDQSEKYFQEAAQILENLPTNTIDEFWFHIHYGKLERLQKNYQKSKELYDTANKIIQSPTYIYLRANLLNEYGFYWLDRNQLDSAQYYFQKGVDLYYEAKTEEVYNVCDSYNNLGDIYVEKGETDKALDAYKKSYEIGKRFAVIDQIYNAADRIFKMNPDNDSINEEISQMLKNKKFNLDINKVSSKDYLLQNENLIEKEGIILKQLKNLKQRSILIGLLITGLIIGVVIFYFIKKQNIKLKENKEELISLNKDLKEANIIKEKTLNERNLALNRLQDATAVLSHDFKNPLNAIYQFTELSKQNLENNKIDEIKEYLHHVSESSLRLNKMVEWLYSHSFQTLQIRKDMTDVDLNKTLQQITLDLKMMIDEKDAIIQLNLLPIIRGHDILVHQIFQNLISNSLKYSDPNRPPVIKIWSETLEDYQAIYIQDNGIGIPEDHISKVFEKQYQVDAHEDEKKGMGLGLNTCREIIEMLSGKIEIESTVGEGTTIIIYFSTLNS